MWDEELAYTPDGALDATTGTVAGSSDFDIWGLLGSVRTGVETAARTVLDFQKQRDALSATREDQAFARYLRGAELDLARSRVAVGSELEKVKAQTMLEVARAQLSAAMPSDSVTRWGVALTAIGVIIAIVALKRGR